MLWVIATAWAAKPAVPTKACEQQLEADTTALLAEAAAAWTEATAEPHPDVACAGAERFIDHWSDVSVSCDDQRGMHERDLQVEQLSEARATLERLGDCWDLESPALTTLHTTLAGTAAKACFVPLFESERGLPPRIDLRITIPEVGPATSHIVQPGYDTFEACLADTVAGVTFPASTRGTRVVYPFVLQR